ncbi:MAG: GNAT family N-acetyltransferase [Treponema sp.]|nr:GNAT family N-acetyltransferase [Treponema sp.]
MTIKKTDANDIETLMQIRLEMLRVVNNLNDSEDFSDQLLECSREYFLNGDQTTVFAMDGDKIEGCASLSYTTIMPTFDHPTGKRAHLMNVYTRSQFRRRGVGKMMVQFLIDEAKSRGVTEISLDATQMGHFLYKSLGFNDNVEGMILSIK